MCSLSGMREGAYRIFCSPLDNSGMYCDSPPNVTLTVAAPRGLDIRDTVNLDYPSGTHSNTEYYDLGAGNYCIRVNHTGGLSGTWTSAEIDMSVKRRYRVQGDFIFTLLDASATWDALWPSPKTWNTKDMGKRWLDLFAGQASAKVSAKLKWGDTSGSYPNEAKLFEVFAIEADAQYFQVEVAIEDTNDNQYFVLDGSGGNTVATLKFYD